MKRDVEQPQSHLDLIDLIVDEILERQRKGDSPCMQEYLDRYPELAEEIEEIFPALALMEVAKPTSQDFRAEQLAVAENRLTATDLTVAEQIGDYLILRQLGRGGMGVVYEAQQRSLGRRVALKVLPIQMAADDQSLARFQREAQAAAQLQHANIVPVYDVGNDAEHFYYAMQLIHGQGLDRVISDLRKIGNSKPLGKWSSDVTERVTQRMMARTLHRSNATEHETRDSTCNRRSAPTTPITAAAYSQDSTQTASLPGKHDLSSPRGKRSTFHRCVAEIGEQAASALAYAHAQGIIHRDVKPSNLMLDYKGTVWVVDFGLAKIDDSAMTCTGDLLGTLRYMSPERFQGQCDVRADIYGLGLTLYELVSLRPAFHAKDHLSLLDQIKNVDATSLRCLDSRVPRDLETIIQKCIDKDPLCRYQTAQELADDLGRFVNDDPILARRLSKRERTTRWIRRNRSLTVALTSIFTLLVTFGIVASFSAHHFSELAQENMDLARETEQERIQAIEARQDAVKAREFAEQQRDLADTQRELAEQQRDLAHGFRYGMQLGDAFLSAVNAPGDESIGQVVHDWRLTPTRYDTRGWVWHYLSSSFSNADLSLARHETGLRDVAFDPAGKFVISVGVHDAVKFWEMPTGHLVDVLPSMGPNIYVEWSPTRKFIAIGRFIKQHRPGYALIHVVDMESRQVFPFVVDTTDSSINLDVCHLEWLSDSELLFHQMDNSCTVIAVPSMKVIRKHTVRGLKSGSQATAWSRELDWSKDREYCAYATESEVVITDREGNIVTAKEVLGLAKLGWGTTSNRLWTCDHDGVIEVWDVFSDFASLRRLSIKTPATVTPSFGRAVITDDCTKIAVPCVGGIICVFSLQDGRRLLQLNSPYAWNAFLEWDPQGRWLAKRPWGWNGQVAMWDIDRALRDGASRPKDQHLTLATEESSRHRVKIVWSKDGRRIAACNPHSIVIWDANTLHEITRVEPDARWVDKDPPIFFNDLQFSPDSRLLATTSLEVELFDAETGERIWTSDVYGTADAHGKNQPLGVDSIAWSPTGDLLAVSGFEQPIAILDSSTGKRNPDSPFYEQNQNLIASHLAFLDWSKAGLFWAQQNSGIGLWRPGKAPQVLSGVSTDLYLRCHVSVSGDGRKLVCPGADNRIKVFDLHAPGRSSVMVGHESWIKHLSWSFDSKRLASCDSKGVLRIWDPENEVGVGTIQGVLGHAFDPTGPRLAIVDVQGNVGILDATASYERECPMEFLPVIERRLQDNSADKAWLQKKAIALCRQGEWDAASQIYRQIAERDSSHVTFTPGWWAVHEMHVALADWSLLAGLPGPDLQDAFNWFAPIESANGYVEFHKDAPFVFNPIFSMQDQPVELAIYMGDAKAIWLNGTKIWERPEDATSEILRLDKKNYDFHAGWNMIVAERNGEEGLRPRAGCAVRVIQSDHDNSD